MSASGANIGATLENTSFFVRVRLVASQPSEGDTNRSRSPSSSTWPEQRLPQGNEATTGEALQTPEKLKDLQGVEGAFCVFGRLSIRMPGIFRLRFVLYQTKENGIEELTSCLSDTFEVFSPKLFKGMKQSTALTRHFASQGLKIKLRQDATMKPRKKKDASEDGRGEAGDAQASVSFLVPRAPSGGPGGPDRQRQYADGPQHSGQDGHGSTYGHLQHMSGQGSRHPDDRPPGAGGSGMIAQQGLMSLPPLTTAVPSSVWFTNPVFSGREDPNTGQSYGSQGGVSFQQGIRHGGDDGMLPPMSFGRLPQQIYDGLLPTTPGGGIAGTGNLASFSLKNIGGGPLGPPAPPGSLTSNLNLPMSNQTIKRFDDDLHRLFGDGADGGRSDGNSTRSGQGNMSGAGPRGGQLDYGHQAHGQAQAQVQSHGQGYNQGHGRDQPEDQYGQGSTARSPMAGNRDAASMRLTLPPPKPKHQTEGGGSDLYGNAQG